MKPTLIVDDLNTGQCITTKAGTLRKLEPRPQCRLLHIRSSRKNEQKISTTRLESYGEAAPDSPLPRPGNRFLPLRELLEFAQWAFGSDGLPNLQIIAYGDFSHNGRYTKHTELFCRN